MMERSCTYRHLASNLRATCISDINVRDGELRYAVLAHRGFFHGGKVPKLEELSWIGFDESLRRVATARWLDARLPGMRPRLRAESIIAIMHAAAAGMGAAVIPLFAADANRSLRRVTNVLEELRVPLWILNHANVRENARVRALSLHLATTIPMTLKKLQQRGL
jgi:DNA-binding transcriptional LysR family regulator